MHASNGDDETDSATLAEKAEISVTVQRMLELSEELWGRTKNYDFEGNRRAMDANLARQRELGLEPYTHSWHHSSQEEDDDDDADGDEVGAVENSCMAKSADDLMQKLAEGLPPAYLGEWADTVQTGLG